jgi:hypothetical protein
MDYKGQQLSENIYYILTILFGVNDLFRRIIVLKILQLNYHFHRFFFIGYRVDSWICPERFPPYCLWMGRWACTFLNSKPYNSINLEKFIIHSLNDLFFNSIKICIPDWPFFNRNKVIWADEVSQLASKSEGKKSKEKKDKADKTKN